MSGGFLVPGKSVGAINVVALLPNGTASSIYQLSVDKGELGRLCTRPVHSSLNASAPLAGNKEFNGWFYHRAVLKDVDGDGLLDVVVRDGGGGLCSGDRGPPLPCVPCPAALVQAARATKPLLGAEGGELVWLRQPPGPSPLAPSALPWAEAPLYNASFAPDVFFRLTALRASEESDEQCVYASFFTGGGLGLLVCPGCGPGGGHTWSETDRLVQVTLDRAIGPSFDVQVVDLNADGRLDLVRKGGGSPDPALLPYILLPDPPAASAARDESRGQRHPRRRVRVRGAALPCAPDQRLRVDEARAVRGGVPRARARAQPGLARLRAGARPLAVGRACELAGERHPAPAPVRRPFSPAALAAPLPSRGSRSQGTGRRSSSCWRRSTRRTPRAGPTIRAWPTIARARWGSSPPRTWTATAAWRCSSRATTTAPWPCSPSRTRRRRRVRVCQCRQCIISLRLPNAERDIELPKITYNYE